MYDCRSPVGLYVAELLITYPVPLLTCFSQLFYIFFTCLSLQFSLSVAFHFTKNIKHTENVFYTILPAIYVLACICFFLASFFCWSWVTFSLIECTEFHPLLFTNRQGQHRGEGGGGPKTGKVGCIFNLYL